MSKRTPSLQEELKNLLQYLCYTSPAYNRLTQMLLILPQKAKKLWGMYPDLMEREEELMTLFSLRYTGEGFIEAQSYNTPLGLHLAGLYRSLFEVLADPNKRERLLRLAGLSEEEFKKIDPLRAWIEVSLDYLAKADKDSLKLLSVVVEKLSGKRPEESVSWEEIGRAANVSDLAASARTLHSFFLLPYKSSYYVCAKECPLLLDIYSDLRAKLKELLR
jgi:hypothetical protein